MGRVNAFLLLDHLLQLGTAEASCAAVGDESSDYFVLQIQLLDKPLHININN